VARKAPQTKPARPKAKPDDAPAQPKREPKRKTDGPAKTKGKAKPAPQSGAKKKNKPRKRSPKPVGRPSKIDQPVRVMVPHPTTGKPQARILTVGDAFVAVLETGCSIETAAAVVGIGKRTVFNWMSQAEEHAESEVVPAGAEKYLHFSQAVTRAREQVVTIALAGILEHAKTDWRAAAWFLERSRPQEYGRSTKIDLGATGADGGRMTLAELMASASTDPSMATDGDDPDVGS
jgi:transposase-like protein